MYFLSRLTFQGIEEWGGQGGATFWWQAAALSFRSGPGLAAANPRREVSLKLLNPSGFSMEMGTLWAPVISEI